MCRSRFVALLAIVALLGAPMVDLRPSSGCTQCPPDCPMHARRLKCHHGGGASCHDGGVRFAARGCGHASQTPVTPGLRAILAYATAAPVVVVAAHAAPRDLRWRPRALPEPRPDPPRPLLVA